MNLKKGDKIRLKVRTAFGWKGLGIVTMDQCGELVRFRKDGDPDDGLHDDCYACRHEVAKLRLDRLTRDRTRAGISASPA